MHRIPFRNNKSAWRKVPEQRPAVRKSLHYFPELCPNAAGRIPLSAAFPYAASPPPWRYDLVP